jgi:hypothetical protein
MLILMTTCKRATRDGCKVRFFDVEKRNESKLERRASGKTFESETQSNKAKKTS